MKKILFMAALAATVMSSCSNDDDFANASSVTNSNEIAFQTTNPQGATTRAVVESLSDFYVTAVTQDKDAYIQHHLVSLSGGTFQSQTAKLYWPTSGTLNFYAINDDQPITIVDGIPQYTFSAIDGDKDIVAALRTGTSKMSVVPLTFNHILTRVGFKVKSTDSNLVIKLKSITMNASNSGTYIFGSSTGASGTWKSGSGFNGYSWTKSLPYEINSTQTEYASEYLNLMPNSDGIAINVEYEVYQNGIKIADYTGSNCRGVELSNSWKPSQVINYVLSIGASEDSFKFTSTVNSWDSETNTGYTF